MQRCLTPACLSNANNCSGCGGGGGGGGQGLSTVDPRQYPATRSVPGMFPETPIPNNCSVSPTRPDPGPITGNRGQKR